MGEFHLRDSKRVCAIAIPCILFLVFSGCSNDHEDLVRHGQAEGMPFEDSELESLKFTASVDDELAAIDRQIADREIAPPDVYLVARQIEAELELIRRAMGLSEDPGHLFTIKKASPRQAYFLAETLCRRCNALDFEHGGQYKVLQEIAPAQVEPRNVYRLALLSLQKIRALKSRLNILGVITNVERNPDATPSQVFDTLACANRIINTMLMRKFLPRDVYQRLKIVVLYLSDLLVPLKGGSGPPFPRAQTNKVPRDVLQQLLKSQTRLQKLLSGARMPAPQLELGESENIVPGDVYLMASLILSEVSGLHADLERAPLETLMDYPQSKFPSDVFQLAEFVDLHLAVLEEYAVGKENWLESYRDEHSDSER